MRTPSFHNEATVSRRPHAVAPSKASVRVVLVTQTYDAVPGTSDAGLSVTITGTAKMLRVANIQAEVWYVSNVIEFGNRLYCDCGVRPVTHVVFNTPSFVWPYPVKPTVAPESIQEFACAWPDIEFVQLNHSGMAFISIDTYGMKHIRDCLHLAMTMSNVRVAGNNPRFVDWVSDGLGGTAVLLPNLYDITTFRHNTLRSRVDYAPLRIGSFGAGRAWKNQLCAAEAAVVLSRRLGTTHMELYANVGRWFGPDSQRAEESRAELFEGLPGAKLVDVPWQAWPKFRQVVATMDILLSPSFSETFCMIVADGIAEGVPSVVTSAMEWTPRTWQADPDDPCNIARVGMGLLHDRIGAAQDGRNALTSFVKHGVHRWVEYLTHEIDLI